MSPVTYKPETTGFQQLQDWTCSVHAASWAVRSLGINVSPAAMQDRMVDADIMDSTVGLHFGDGRELAKFLRDEFGLDATNHPSVSFAWVSERAGHGPIALGGHGWGPEGHWVAVRRLNADGSLAIANSAEGHEGIEDRLSANGWALIQPCSAVWVPMESEE
jgi:hypothetical protein